MCRLTELPEEFGVVRVSRTRRTLSYGGQDVTVGGHLHLNSNQLRSLPESFGHITVAGDLQLNYNELESLPESFGRITVGGSLSLSNNEVHSLPESFGHITVGGDLWLKSWYGDIGPAMMRAGELHYPNVGGRVVVNPRK